MYFGVETGETGSGISAKPIPRSTADYGVDGLQVEAYRRIAIRQKGSEAKVVIDATIRQ
jgi:hypothetical protein